MRETERANLTKCNHHHHVDILLFVGPVVVQNVPKSSFLSSSSSFGEEKHKRVERRGTVGRDRGGEQRGVGERDGKTRAGAEIGGARLWTTTIRFFSFDRLHPRESFR